MKILVLYDHSGPKYHRCLLPCFLMPGVELKVSNELTDEQCEGVDIVFFNRVITNNRIMDVEALREKHGFKLVVDFDDHWQLGPDHILYDMYQYTQADLFMIEYLKLADAVTVTHERLAAEALVYNKNVHILPNAIPKWGQFDIQKVPSEVTRLFWAGGVTHEKDIELLKGPVKRFSGLPVKMVMGGWVDNPQYKRMASAFTNGGRLPNELFKSNPVQEYYQAYAHCDIALIPLTDTKFNQNKSNLKILEAANIGANVIVSNVHPYKDIPGVLYVNSSADWYRHVKQLTESGSVRQYLTEQLTEYVDKYFNFDRINAERRQIFVSLCRQKTEIDLKPSAIITEHG